MATKLFVGKLSYNTTSESLQKLFEQYGAVISAQVIMDRETNRSKGFAFVEMEKQTDAQQAIKTLDGHDFEGRTIAVNVAKPRVERAPFRNSFGTRDNFRRS